MLQHHWSVRLVTVRAKDGSVTAQVHGLLLTNMAPAATQYGSIPVEPFSQHLDVDADAPAPAKTMPWKLL